MKRSMYTVALLTLSACSQAASFSLAGGCKGIRLTDSGSCFETTYNPYRNHESCYVNVQKDAKLSVRRFDVENHSRCGWDFFEVNGQKFCGSTGPSGKSVKRGARMRWYTDYSVTKGGFKICAASSGNSGSVLSEPGCYVKTPKGCPNRNYFNAKTWRRDFWGEEHHGAGKSRSACLTKRKNDYNRWCGETVQMQFIEGYCSPDDMPRLAGGFKCNGSCLNGNKAYHTLLSAWDACGKILDCARVIYDEDRKFRLRRRNDISILGKWRVWGYTWMYHVEYPYSCRESAKKKTCGEYMVEEVNAVDHYTSQETCPDPERKGWVPYCGERGLVVGDYCQGPWQCGSRKSSGRCPMETYKIVGYGQYVLNERDCPITDNQRFYTTTKNWIAMTGGKIDYLDGRNGQFRLEQWSSSGNHIWTGQVKVHLQVNNYEIWGEVVGSRQGFTRFNKGDMLSLDMDLNPRRRLPEQGMELGAPEGDLPVEELEIEADIKERRREEFDYEEFESEELDSEEFDSEDLDEEAGLDDEDPMFILKRLQVAEMETVEKIEEAMKEVELLGEEEALNLAKLLEESVRPRRRMDVALEPELEDDVSS